MFEKYQLFQVEFKEPIELVEFSKLQRYKLHDTIREFKSRMYDIHFEIMDMVEVEVKLLK